MGILFSGHVCHVAGPESRFRRSLSAMSLSLMFMLKSHKRAIAGIKSAQQRVAKATEERDKQKEKLKKAEARLKAEKENLRTNQEKLES